MTNISFRQLLELLPRAEEYRSKKLPAGLSYVAGSNPRFVEPTLDVTRAVQASGTSLVLLSAPGAVGKSTLAAELASRTGAVLWDLANINVGSGTFSGKVLDAYGSDAAAVIKRINTGEFLFVLDALDEAQVRAGSQNFDAFLEDIASTFRAARARPTVILLARNETADWIDLVLQDRGVPLARYQVAYFDEAQAVAFIEKRLDDLSAREGTATVHRQQPGPFAQARSELFGTVCDLFEVPRPSAWQDHRVRDFLGYAPVLEALADFLNVGNYAALLQGLKQQAAAARTPWQFLAEIIKRLQEREQQKILVAVRTGLEPKAKSLGWSDWEGLYDSQEQCARVLAYTLRLPEPPTREGLPPALSNQYEDSLKTILPQHPFLSGRKFANVVFREFVYAWGLTRAKETSVQALRKVMRGRDEPFLPSPLFAEFVVSLAGGGAVIDGQDFGIVYESFLSRNRKMDLSLVATDAAIEASIVLEAGREEGREIEILDTGTGVHFWRRLQQADISVPGGVRLGLPEQRFQLGPNVDIECGEFAVVCDDLDVNPSGDVSVRATSHAWHSPNPRLRVMDSEGGRLTVSWPSLGHPWISHKGLGATGRLRLDQVPKGDVLRKFILMFRRQNSRKEDTVRSARWAPHQSKDRDALLQLALDSGVLTRTQEFLQFSSEYITMKSLVDSQPQLSPSAKKFVTSYLGSTVTDSLLAPE